MNFLLDTHTLIWFLENDAQLSEFAANEILKPSNKSYLSIASTWEIAIKKSLNKLEMNTSFESLFNLIFDNNFEILQIEFFHLEELLQLKKYHRDPFDGLIIAQAISQKYNIITKYKDFKKYDVEIIW
jgi:PIN domain nuclease of toxin-antitoxin system